jgi:polyvinyl alcohol dehydrogenase (cytochrome)
LVIGLSQWNAPLRLSRPAQRGQTGQVRIAPLGLSILLALGAGCSSAPAHHASAPPSAAPPSRHAAAHGATNWPVYHANEARTGDVARLPAAGRLSVAWSRPLGGAVYGQPLVIGSTVVVGTETDEVFGLSWATGKILWHTRVGTPLPLSEQPCGNINPLGITSTGGYDPQTRLVYEVAQTGRTGHELVGLRVSNGKVAFRRSVPSPDHQPFYDQQRGALAIERGRIYVVFGGHYGDCGPYRGSVVGLPASGHGSVVSYLVPTSQQGGIWGTGGPVIAPNGTIYVSAGNGAVTEKKFDGSDSVTALTPALKRIGIFAPTNWQALSAGDLDLGSMSPALLADGRILQVGKSAVAYLLNGHHLGGVGGQLASGPACSAYGGAAVTGDTVYLPCMGGMAAIDTAGTRVRVLWRSPVTGVLYELNPRNGTIRHQISVAGSLPDFASPTLSGRLALIGTRTGVVAVTGV